MNEKQKLLPLKKFTSLADQEIRKAQEQGAFDNLPGAGKPIPGLDDPYDELWWVKSLLKRENLSVLPETLALRAEIEKDITHLWRLTIESEVRLQIASINEKIRKLNSTATVGPATTLSEMDSDTVLDKWRATRRRGSSGA